MVRCHLEKTEIMIAITHVDDVRFRDVGRKLYCDNCAVADFGRMEGGWRYVLGVRSYTGKSFPRDVGRA
jgi:hypothetical protein